MKPDLKNITEDEFKDKVVLITGGSSGIGLALCRLFSVHKAKVINFDIHTPSQTFSKVFFKTDVSEWLEVKNNINIIVQQEQRIDIVINNAGIRYYGNILEVSSEYFRRMLEINVLGYWNIAKAVIPYLNKTKGILLNICSGDSMELPPHIDGYYASKGATYSLTNALRSSFLNKDIHIRGISSACHVETPLFTKNVNINKQSINHLYQAQEIAEIVLRLASKNNLEYDTKVFTF